MVTTAATHDETATAPRRITVRRPVFGFDGVPKAWLNNSVVASHIANGVSILFPLGERSFVRAVHDCLPLLKDRPELAAQAKLFFAQEGAHSAAHEDHTDMLRAQGYDLDGLLAAYAQYHRLTQRLPRTFRLAVTAALEHYTAIMAENLFTFDVLREVDPTMARLLKWHAAEEIEHKAVAFDVLAAVAPSYPLRAAGMAYATASFMAWWVAATAMLLRQERLPRGELRRQLREARQRHPIVKRVFLRGLREYFARDFHPNQRDTYPLAQAFFADDKAAAGERATRHAS
ncbi:MAG: metal-dependent hydrolase [Myxococcales bacterium]|nr:metal-dependent hydrolase [Myxococcales bacterium]